MKAFASHIKTAWLVCGATLLLIVAIEITSYVLVSIRYAVASRQGALVDWRHHADAYGNADWVVEYFNEENSRPLYNWHSYIYWRPAPFRGKYTNVDEEGLRRTWSGTDNEGFSEMKSRRIFMFGGSTMLGTGARDDETIPSFVAKMLTQEYRFNVRVTNFGTGGYITTQDVISLVRELQRGNIPDLAVFYDGGNDTFSTLQNRGMAGIPQNEPNRVREFNLLKPQMIKRLYRETLVETFINSSTYLVVSSFVRRITGRDLLNPASWNDSIYPPVNQVANEVVRVYSWNVRFVRNLGHLYGFRTLFYWQPVVFTKDKLTPYEQDAAKNSHHFRQHYDAATTAAKNRLADVDVFHDISSVFNGDAKPYFIDSMHMTGAGNEIIARRMLQDVVPIIEQWRPGEPREQRKQK